MARGTVQASVSSHIATTFPARKVVAVSVIGLLGSVIGGTWDVWYHVNLGRESFFSPPHYLIYLGIIMRLVALAAGTWVASRETGGFMAGLRRYPVLTAVMIATIFQLLSAPFDEFWHRQFGLDVTIWSPPHMVLILGGMFSSLALASVQLWAMVHLPSGANRWDRIILLLSSSAMVHGFLFSLREFEFPVLHQRLINVVGRPVELYPFLFSLTLAFGLMVIYRVAGGRFPGLQTGLLVWGLDLVVNGILHASGGRQAVFSAPWPLVGLAVDLLLPRLSPLVIGPIAALLGWVILYPTLALQGSALPSGALYTWLPAALILAPVAAWMGDWVGTQTVKLAHR